MLWTRRTGFLQACWRQRIPETWETRGYEWPKDVPIEELIFVPKDAQYWFVPAMDRGAVRRVDQPAVGAGRLARELFNQQRPEGVGRQVRRSSSGCRRARSLELQMRPRGADLRNDAGHAVRGIFGIYTRAIGLADYHLPDMDQVATISHQYYDNHLRGGEGHMEVGKLIQSVERRKAHMVISVKPFGCMPSSGVSDGIQSLITARYPEAIFTAIETTGDGEVNVQSRIQMDLFKARKRAEEEFRSAVERSGFSSSALAARLRRRTARALHQPPHVVAGTAANQVLELAGIAEWRA
jgi:hypothetical protein